MSRCASVRFSLVHFPVFVHLYLPVLSCEPAAGDTNGYDDEEEETNQKNLAGSGAGYLQSRTIFYPTLSVPHILIYSGAFWTNYSMSGFELHVTLSFFTQYF